MLNNSNLISVQRTRPTAVYRIKRSEGDLQRHLRAARVVGLQVALEAETCISKRRVGLAKPWRVECVERLEPELDLQPLPRIEALEHRRVHQRGTHLTNLRPSRTGHPQRLARPLDPHGRLVRRGAV